MTSTSTRREIWRERIADWWANAWRWVLAAFGAVAATYFILERGVVGGATLAIVIGGFVIAAALTASKPLAIALFAMPGLLVAQRIGLGGGDLSVSDAALAAAFGTALLLGQRPYSRPLRQLLLINLVYQFATLFTVIVNPYALNTVEWFHAWLLVSGALIVGWALGAAGYARLALSLIVFTACVFAVATLVAGRIPVRGRRLRSGDADLAVPDAQELHRHGARVRRDHRVPQPRLGRLDQGLGEARVLADGGGHRGRSVPAGAHRARGRDHRRGAAPGHDWTLSIGAPAAHPRGVARDLDGGRPGRVPEPPQLGLPASRVAPRGVPLLAGVADLRARAALLVQPRRTAVPAAAGRVGGARLRGCRRAHRVHRDVDRRARRALACRPAVRHPRGRRAALPSRAVAVRPVLGRRAGVGAVRGRGHLPGRDGSRAKNEGAARRAHHSRATQRGSAPVDRPERTHIERH